MTLHIHTYIPVVQVYGVLYRAKGSTEGSERSLAMYIGLKFLIGKYLVT